jgi:antitoxin (DNA-binding transcriptional repressor) of toxin-antitoxin stability system
MRFISVRDLRGKSAEVWRDLVDEREMVVTSNGRPIAILAAVDESSLEAALRAFRRARAADAVAALQRASVARGDDDLTPEAVEEEIAAVRGKRRR